MPFWERVTYVLAISARRDFGVLMFFDLRSCALCLISLRVPNCVLVPLGDLTGCCSDQLQNCRRAAHKKLA